MIEKQHFFQNKIIWILIPCIFIFNALVVGAVDITVSIAPIFLIVLFSFIRLVTIISKEGISYQFFPFHLKPQLMKWEDISKAYIREYKPVAEYGGWGVRGFFSSSGRAYNVSGNVGLQVELKNGKKILIGTQKQETIEELLARINKSVSKQ